MGPELHAVVCSRLIPDLPPHSRLRMKTPILSVGLLALLAFAVACGSSAVEPRYRNFSARDATLELADLPAGWELLPAADVPSLQEFLPEDTDLIDSAVMVAGNGEDDPSALQLVAVGVALVGGEGDLGQQGVAGIALRAALSEFALSQLNFVTAVPVDSPTPGSKLLTYSFPIDGAPLITNAINFRDGRVFADVEVVAQRDSTPDPDLDELAALVYDRITQQLEPDD